MEQVELISNQLDVMTVILAYLSRKNKFKMRSLNTDFRDKVVPMSMVSLIFKGQENLLSDVSLFSKCISTCRKVEKLTIDSVDINLSYVKAFQACLKGQSVFTSRVKHLQICNIKFVTEDPTNDAQRDYIIGIFCQALALFDGLDTLEFENVSNLGVILAFFNHLSIERISFLRSVRHLNLNACPIASEEEQDMTFIEIKDFVKRCTDLEGS